MSACGEFAEHVWKPGSCKNCFHPRSAHQSNGNPTQVRVIASGSEEDSLTLPASYCKPTIAVRPTMMNSDTSDVWADVNMNTEQDNQKTSIDRLEIRKMLDLPPFCVDNNGCSKGLKESALHNASLEKLDHPSRFSPGTLSISSIFVAQDEGHGSQGLKDILSSDSEQLQITKKFKNIYIGKSSYQPGDSAQRQEVRMFTSRSCDGYSEVLSPVQEQQGPLEIAISIITTTPTNTMSTRRPETSSNSSSSSLTPDYRQQMAHPCNHASDFTNLSDSCSYQSSTDSLAGSQGNEIFLQSGLESPTTCPTSSNPLADTRNGLQNVEPIYAESTKRKRRPLSDRQSQQNSDQEVELTREGQRAKITVVAACADEHNRTFYLSSPDSAVSTQWQHFSPDSTKDPGSPAFKWPPGCSGAETASASVHPKPQTSPPVPPKKCSRAPKLGTSRSSSGSQPELLEPGVCEHPPSPAQAWEKSPGDAQTSASEWRQKLQGSTWTRNGRIEEVEEAEEAEPGVINGAAVLVPRDWSPTTRTMENSLPGTANNGTSQEHPGCSVEKGKHYGNMLTKATSFTADLLEGPSESRDPTPPPPPPKKHLRPSSKMSQSSLDLEKANRQGSMESLTQSLRTLKSNTTASSDSLHCDSRVFPDIGHQDSPLVASPSLFPSSPVTSSPVSPHPDPFPSTGLDLRLQPPPLPEKKMVNRTVSAPDGAGGKLLPRGCPRLPFSGSEGNVSRPDRAPSSPVDQRNLFSSSEFLERCAQPLSRSLRSRTLDEPLAQGRSRLGGCFHQSATSSSSPQLSAPIPSPTSTSGSSLHLQSLLSNIDSREGIYSKLGGLYAESLRRLAVKCEEHFTRNQRNPLRFNESNWSLFKLSCNRPCCDARDSVYYSASCASDPSNSYAVKICKSQTPDAKKGDVYGLSVQQSMPPHFNVQQDCGHFIACVPQSMLPTDGHAEPRGQGERERVVVITREVPRQSVAGFVQEWAAFHQAQPELYERRVCFLLLQLCNGLEHLKEQGVTHRHLCLENLLLVPHRTPQTQGPDQTHLPRLLISNFAKAKQRGSGDPAADPRLKRDHARLAPEIVSASQYRKFDEFQTGILIYELLHQPNPFEVSPKLKEQDYDCEDLPPVPAVSLYSSGLQQLARLLLQPDPIKRIHIQEAKRALQCLLWGPRQDLMEQQWEGPGERRHYESLLNWLDVKRALLMMKFAERSLEPERNAQLEDWLCCQYFSSAHPLSLCHTAELLYSHK